MPAYLKLFGLLLVNISNEHRLAGASAGVVLCKSYYRGAIGTCSKTWALCCSCASSITLTICNKVSCTSILMSFCSKDSYYRQ